ncbi:MAG TPA: SDR family NAD(P)-dependent oxidoreductase, partial [Conexibacter sp.]|nr:SDR family NAD(P)-dependent oxidoreductase [Conexibacter sp.]
MELEGRTALVTGGGRGIGRAISQALAEAGAAVAVVYRRDADAAAEVVEGIRSRGGRAAAFAASIDALDALPALVAAVTAELGPVDALVCNAGQASRGDAVADTEPGEVARLLGTHALAAHRLAQLTIPSMRAAARGDVVVISSSEVAQMRAGGAPYNMA